VGNFRNALADGPVLWSRHRLVDRYRGRATAKNQFGYIAVGLPRARMRGLFSEAVREALRKPNKLSTSATRSVPYPLAWRRSGNEKSAGRR